MVVVADIVAAAPAVIMVEADTARATEVAVEVDSKANKKVVSCIINNFSKQWAIFRMGTTSFCLN